ncbi:hypothetical protein IJD44_01500 [bacterium]|nr:hypothetical protein [bacterium]
MSQPVNSQYYTTGTPIYNYPETNTFATQQGQTVSVAPTVNNNAQIYQYPTASVYDPARQASGVNIIINNPAGYTNGALMPYYPGYPQVINNIPPQATPVVNNFTQPPVANTPISTEQSNTGKTKRITQITDDYIKMLESYLRNDSKEARKMGITQLIKLCEEDTSRYNNPALIALLNIALQDVDASNRIYAMTPLCVGTLGGDDNTIKILQGLKSSDKNYGQEAAMANEALLNVARSTQEVPDYSVKKKKE